MKDVSGDSNCAVGDGDDDRSERCDVGVVGKAHRDGGASGDEMRGNVRRPDEEVRRARVSE